MFLVKTKPISSAINLKLRTIPFPSRVHSNKRVSPSKEFTRTIKDLFHITKSLNEDKINQLVPPIAEKHWLNMMKSIRFSVSYEAGKTFQVRRF